MKTALATFTALALFVAAGPVSVSRVEAAGPVVQVVQITGHRTRFDQPGVDAFVRYLLIDPANAEPARDGFAPVAPRAILMLFTGSTGALGLGPAQRNVESTNFLARTRYHFAARGYVVALVDAASDFLEHNHPDIAEGGFRHGSGLRGHRLPNRLHGDQHLLDLAAVTNDLRGRYRNLRLWAVGTSRGTLSAAVAAASLASPPDGIVLTAALTGPSAVGDLRSVDLGLINVPALIITHKDDGCPQTRAEDSMALKKRFTASRRVQVLTFQGRDLSPLSGPCDALSPHGFFGIEQKVIDAIAKWIDNAGRNARF